MQNYNKTDSKQKLLIWRTCHPIFDASQIKMIIDQKTNTELEKKNN